MPQVVKRKIMKIIMKHEKKNNNWYESYDKDNGRDDR
jgi:hypothetical protein